jgi:predicted transcriptional regulator
MSAAASPVEKVSETRFVLSLPSSLRDSLFEVARREDRSAAWVIRRAIAEYLERHREAPTAP